MLLRTLGKLELQDSSFQRPKTLLLLAYLAIEGSKERQHLATLLWPDATAKERLNRLRVMLSQLRKEASVVIEVDKGQLGAKLETDAKNFLADFETGSYEEALRHYAGPFLQGVQQADWSVELEEWVYGTREFLASRAREALLRLGEKEASRGLFKKAAKRAEAAYILAGAAEPEPEDLIRCYTLLVAGKHPRASEVRKEAQGFGMTLGLSLEEAREQLKQDKEPDELKPGTPNLPLRNTSFISRDAELIEITELLAQPDCQLLTLYGPGGVGKTRLAVHAALEQYQLGRFPDGVFFVALEALTSVQAIPTAIASAIGLELQSHLDPLGQLQAHQTNKETLLILDNYEHLLAAALLPSQLLQTSPRLKLLITSRERLNLEEEWALEVEGLSLPPEDITTLKDITSFAAVQLFTSRAKRANRSFTLSHEYAWEVARICRLTQGFPLALELAATWTKHLSCKAIAEELGKSLDFLSGNTRNMPERHKSMRAVFEHSWKLLTPKEQQLLRTLSVFRGGFRHEAAAEVAGATIASLASLVDKSLLRLSTSGRYDRHPLLYQYTEEKLAEHLQEQSQVQEKHGGYYFALLQHWEGSIRIGSHLEEALKVVEEELENIRSAWRWAVSALRLEELPRATFILLKFYEMRGRSQEGIALFQNAVMELQETTLVYHRALGYLFIAQACLYIQLSEYRKTEHLADRGLTLLGPLEDTEGIMWGLENLGEAACKVSDYARAEKHFKEGLQLAEEQQAQVRVSDFMHWLGWLKTLQGHHEQAKRYLFPALELHRKLGRQDKIADTLNSLGHLLLEDDSAEEAEPLLQEGLRLARKLNYRTMILYSLNNLALVAYELRAYEQAQNYCQEAMQVAETLGNSADHGLARVIGGRVAIVLGDYVYAQDCLLPTIKLFWSIQYIAPMLLALISWAELQVHQGEAETAASILGLALHHPATGRYSKLVARRLEKTLQEHLSPEALAAALERGKAMTLEVAVELVLQTRA